MKKKKQQTTGQIDIQASNVWADQGIIYYETPDEVTMDNHLMAQLMGGPMAIYQRVLALAQRKSRVDIELTSADIRAMGVSKNYVTSSIDKLERAGLVKVTRRLGTGASFLVRATGPKNASACADATRAQDGIRRQRFNPRADHRLLHAPATQA